MKKIPLILLAFALLAGPLAGCARQGEASGTDKLHIVTTGFPEYDWIREILGDEADSAKITTLLDSGVDLHNYQPTADDMVEISNCDLFVYVGGESDDWVEGTLKNAGNENMKTLNLLDALGSSAKTEESVEGMQDADDEHGDADEDDGKGGETAEGGHEEETEYDEHIWLSLKNAEKLCKAISEALQQIDPGSKDAYAANTSAYCEKLSALDEDYRTAVDAAARTTILFGDRFPFRYLADDYGLDYYAAFSGCSAETEASFETISFLARKVDELNLPCVLTIEGTQHEIAKTIVENTAAKSQEVLTMDSMQSTTSKNAGDATTYLSIMENNLSVLKKALD